MFSSSDVSFDAGQLRMRLESHATSNRQPMKMSFGFSTGTGFIKQYLQV